MKKLSVAVIGCGRIAQVYLDIFEKLSDQIDVIAAVDKELDKAQKFATHFTNCLSFDNLDNILDMRIDVLHILTPHYLHKEHAIKALERDFNVLLEKPIATTVEDGKAIIEAAKKSKGKLEVIFQNRYITGVEKLRRMILENKTGLVKGVSSSLTWWRPPSYYECDWKGSWEKEGGGVVIDQAIHSLDLVRYILQDEVEYLIGNIDRRVLTNIEVEDIAEAYLKFNKGTIYTFYACNYFFDNVPIRIDFYYENGKATLLGETMTITLNGKTHVYPNNTDQDVDESLSYWGKNHEKQVLHFYESVLHDSEVFVTGQDALKTLELVRGIYDSAELKDRILLN